MPVLIYVDGLFEAARNKCNLCGDKFRTDNIIKEINCGHLYHIQCIEPWLLNCKKCPACGLYAI